MSSENRAIEIAWTEYRVWRRVAIVDGVVGFAVMGESLWLDGPHSFNCRALIAAGFLAALACGGYWGVWPCPRLEGRSI